MFANPNINNAGVFLRDVAPLIHHRNTEGDGFGFGVLPWINYSRCITHQLYGNVVLSLNSAPQNLDQVVKVDL